MKCRKAYGIMPVGENDRSAHVAQQKAPEVATPGLFYSVLGGWLNPKAGYQLFFSVQPFADVVGKGTVQRAEPGTGLACAGERKDLCWRSPGRNGGMEQRHLPAFETGRAGKGQKLCAGYCPCGAGL